MSRRPQRPRISRIALIALAALLAFTLLLEVLSPREERAAGPLEAAPGFYAALGGGLMLAFWALAFVIRAALGRREDYYLEDVEDGDNA